MTGNVPATVTVDKQNQEGVKTLGWDVVYQTQYNAAGEASWTPFAQAMQSNGVKGLVYTGEPENAANLLKAFDDIEYELDWVVVGANHLDDKFIEVGGPAVKNAYMLSAVVPPFLADENPATQQYLDLFEQVPAGRQVARRCSATTPSRPGSSSPPRPRSAAPTSPGSASTTTPSRSPSGPVAACTRPAIPAPRRVPGAAWWSRPSPDGFAVPDDFEPTDGLFRCDDDSVVKLEGDYGTGHHAGGRRQEPRRPRMT